MAVKQASLRGEATRLLNDHKLATNTSSKIQPLRHLKEILVYREPALLEEFIPYLVELQSERSSPVRKYLAEMFEEMGSKHTEYLHNLVPTLIVFLKDDTPAVARQAITSGINLMRSTLEKVVLQGIHSGQVDNTLRSAWSSMVKLKEAVYGIAFQPGFDGARLLAVKFVETTILLYTPDPTSNPEPPPIFNYDAKLKGFNIKWVAGGHPFLDIEQLGQEASRNLSLLLDQLRMPAVKSLSNPMIIVLVNSLASIANKRASFYGKIMPVLIGLGTNFDNINGSQNTALQNSLKNAFISLLKCSQHGNNPWQVHLTKALQAINGGDVAEHHPSQTNKLLKNNDFHSHETSSVAVQDAGASKVDTGSKRGRVEEVDVQNDKHNKARKQLQHDTPGFISSVGNEDDNNDVNSSCSNGNVTASQMSSSEMNPVQQLVDMFGAIVAQGDRALGFLEILLSQVSADLLAELVMANMPYLPPSCPDSDSEEHEPQSGILHTRPSDESNQLIESLSVLSQVISNSISRQQISMPSESPDQCIQDLKPVSGCLSSLAPAAKETTDILPISSIATPSSVFVQTTVNNGYSSSHLGGEEGQPMQSTIPGLGVLPTGVMKVDTTGESLGSPEQVLHQHLPSGSDSSGLRETSSPDLVTERYETVTKEDSKSEHSRPLATATITSMASVQYSSIAPALKVVPLDREQQTFFSRSALEHIVDSHEAICKAGGFDLRVALLSRLLEKCESEYDVQGLLEKHILSDYVGLKGHELTLQVLYQLYGNMLCIQMALRPLADASTLYENILLTVVQHLRHSFPSTSKLLERLLVEVPFLPDSVLDILRDMCLSSTMDTDVKETRNLERVTQGLTILWNLILYRQPSRSACLEIALQTAVDQFEEARNRAIRLIANRLYQLSYASNRIENFATKMMFSVANNKHSGDTVDASVTTINKEDSCLANVLNGEHSTGEVTSGIDDSGTKQASHSVSLFEAQRCMSLFFALCIKKHSLLWRLFSVYKGAPKAIKQAIQRHLPKLVTTIKASPEMLNIVANPPLGSENLIMQALHVLTEGSPPSRDLINAVKRLYDTKSQDAGVLIPILSSLTKEEVQPLFPRLVDLPPDKFKIALARILQGSAHSGPALTPTEVLILIHGIDPEQDGIPLKKVIDACNACFEQKSVFTQQVLASTINLMIEKTPLPLLFMRTVIQACGCFPPLVSFVKEILVRLVVSKQIWKYPKLWVGFLKCATQTMPDSFNALIQLPAEHLESALTKYPTLRKPLAAYASQPDVKRNASRSILILLGLVQENQQSSAGLQNPVPADDEPSAHTINETQASESAVGS